MPTYVYQAMNSSGQEVKDEIDASTQDEAIAKIRNKGQFATKIKEKAAKKKVAKKGAASSRADPQDADLDRRRAAKATRRTSPASFPPFRTPACPSCDPCRSSNNSRSRACSRRSSVAWETRSKGAAAFPRR